MTKKSFIRQFIEAVVIILPIAFLIRTFGYGLYQVPTGSMETTMLVGERFFADKFTILFKEPTYGDIITFNNPTFNYSKNKALELYQSYIGLFSGPENWTKRVIALPGDEIKGVMENDKPVVYLKKKGEAEFKKLDEPYLNKYQLIAVHNAASNRILDYKSFDPDKPLNDQPFYRQTKNSIYLGEKYASFYGLNPIKYPQTPIITSSGKNIDVYDYKLGPDEYWAMGDNRLNSEDSRKWGPLKRKFIHGKIIFRIWSTDSDESWWILDLIKHPVDFWKRIRWSRCCQRVV